MNGSYGDFEIVTQVLIVAPLPMKPLGGADLSSNMTDDAIIYQV